MQKIVRLSEDVINKIAAGEVVENPASIAKELIENSLDAGALFIDISIEGGGSRLIRIEDNGSGMGPEDALLSLERYATSKIRSEKDLFSLSTMGFRGEALAAIASVSRIELKTSDGETGTQIEAAGGTLTANLPCARNRGTSVAVRDLFFNVPARKKFLKSPHANTAAITRIVETIALAHPEVSFTLKTEEKLSLQMFPEDKKKRIENVLNAMPHEVEGAGLWGLLGSPEEAKVHRRGQFFFINQRPVFSPLVSRAVKMGYGTRMAENAYPSFVLFLEVDPELVDVNVHPQKKEVRFSDEKKIFQLVEQAVAAAFEGPAPVFCQNLSFSEPSFSLAESSLPPSVEQKKDVPLSFDFPIAERPLAIVEGYLFLQSDGLILIDLRLARARILYESLAERKDPPQALLWPIEVVIEDVGIVEELQAMGIECRLIGKRTLAVDALPAFLDGEDFPDFLNGWREGKKLDAAASRYTRSARRTFTIDEAFLIWKKLHACKEKVYDPVGRRIWDKVNVEQLRNILEEG